MWMLGLLACGAVDVTGEYAERKAAALADPGAAKSNWKPEVALRLSPELVVDLISKGVEAGAQDADPIDIVGIGTIKPTARVENLKLQSSAGCDGCVGIKGRLEGKLTVKIAGRKRSLPYVARFTADLKFDTVQRGDARHIEMRVVDVSRLKVEVEDLPGVDVGPLIKDYGTELLEGLDPVDMGDLGGPELHLRDARVTEESGGLRIELLTDAPVPAPIRTWPAPPSTGWQALVSEDALLAMVRREAFAAGDLADGMEIYAEPVALDVEGTRFDLDLRIWRLKGKGWWRDYDISGDLAVQSRHLHLDATDVVEGAKSDGAAVVDPLALLGEGVILETLADACHGSLPAAETMQVGRQRWSLHTTSTYGQGDNLVLEGSVRFTDPSKKGK